jgi:hypothetical protein
MKKVFYLALVYGLTLTQETNAQVPVGFPDGITVGAGASIPVGSTYKMAIAGGIITEKVRVATNGTAFWADFVFDKNYHLRPLSEVESFIKTNKHLPEIPSTSEVTKNGIDLAETQALILQKVEELTLYVIQQNKKIEKLERKVYRFSHKK